MVLGPCLSGWALSWQQVIDCSGKREPDSKSGFDKQELRSIYDSSSLSSCKKSLSPCTCKEAYADRSLSSSNSRALAEMLDDASLDASGDMADLLTTLDDIDTLGEFHSCLEELETNPAFSAMGMDTARLFTSAVQTRMAEVRTRQSVIAQTY